MATSRSQIAGSGASVTSILSNPDQDPHLFEASPSVARQLSAAAIVVYNGADYDPWMAKLLAASRVAEPQRSSWWRTWSAGSPATTRISGTTRRRCRPIAGALAATLAERDPRPQGRL